MSPEAVKLCANLTVREREVAALMALGRTTVEVAAELKCTPATMGSHRARILKKTNCRNMVEFARLAIAGGVVPAP